MALSRDEKFALILLMMLFIQSMVDSSEDTPSDVESPTCKMKEIEYKLGTAIEFANKAMDSLKDVKFDSCPPKPDDCSVLFNCGKKSSGVYTLWPRNRVVENSIQAYCDMETAGGGWTVIQRRGNFGRDEDYFYQDWNAYKEGFGDHSEDFWIGNDIIFALSNQKKYSIRFDLKDLEDNVHWATYDNFWIDSEECNYTLHVNGYRGNAGDSFSYHSGQEFTTKDRDNDKYASSNCAFTWKGAWWYNSCAYSSLNGLYKNGYSSTNNGITWYHWRNYNYSLPFTEIKIKPLWFSQENSEEKIIIPS